MSSHSPITPPPELIEQWANHSASVHRENGTYKQHEFAIATQAARWGSDQELEACCEWLDDTDCDDPQEVAQLLRAARRPKPPSLKEQALARTDAILNDSNRALLAEVRETLELNRRALEQLDD